MASIKLNTDHKKIQRNLRKYKKWKKHAMKLKQIICKNSLYLTSKKAFNNYIINNYNLMAINFGNSSIIFKIVLDKQEGAIKNNSFILRNG